MRRRAFITLVGGMAAAPAAGVLTALAQQPAVPQIGFLGAASPDGYASFVSGFRQGLKETGFVENENVAIVYHWAEGQYDRLPKLAADLVSRHVSVIMATGGLPSSLAAKEATETIPIVFTLGSDPVKFGVVPSLNRPNGNVTGVTLFTYLLDAKRVELLHELVPGASVIALLVNPNSPAQADTQFADVKTACGKFGQELLIVKAGTEGEIDSAVASIAKNKASALLVSSDAFFLSQRDQLIALVTRYAIPSIFEWRQFVEAGGLMSYGIDLFDAYRQAGIYVGKILHGAKPADLPVLQPTKFEFVINLKTAKALGISVPNTMLVAADHVIE
jgi:putative tryptophan/tyrosine transport system substrate-binding protein